MVVREYGRQVSSTLTGRWAGTRHHVRNDDTTADGSTPLALPTLAATPMSPVRGPFGAGDGERPESAGLGAFAKRRYLAAVVSEAFSAAFSTAGFFAAGFFAAGFLAAVFWPAGFSSAALSAAVA